MCDIVNNSNLNTFHFNTLNILNNLFTIYDRVMVLKLFVDCNDNELKNKYIMSATNHNTKLMTNIDYIDAGFDLFTPGNDNNNELDLYGDNIRFFSTGWENKNPVNKIDFKVCCSAKMVLNTRQSFNTGYYMYPRSSLSKTQLRLANSTGIIDAGYRGHLMGMFDVVNITENNKDADYFGLKYDRYLQICAPGLVPIIVEIVERKDDLGLETERGAGGFGSTGR
jgi:dUTPase